MRSLILLLILFSVKLFGQSVLLEGFVTDTIIENDSVALIAEGNIKAVSLSEFKIIKYHNSFVEIQLPNQIYFLYYRDRNENVVAVKDGGWKVKSPSGNIVREIYYSKGILLKTLEYNDKDELVSKSLHDLATGDFHIDFSNIHDIKQIELSKKKDKFLKIDKLGTYTEIFVLKMNENKDENEVSLSEYIRRNTYRKYEANSPINIDISDFECDNYQLHISSCDILGIMTLKIIE